ncbi:MAG: hypothetical protein JKY66_11290 [Spongiibacteraceae bacterium]|nr:hypothetical protein [Spongiibacteraceae bacterium]
MCADFIKQKEARIAELSDMLSDNHDLVTKMRDQLAGRLEIIDHDTKDLIKLRTENDRLSARIVELQDPFGLELDLDSDHIVAESKLWQPEE